jgi:uncharacterized protein involved in exopolysaccharide biosynthesis
MRIYGAKNMTDMREQLLSSTVITTGREGVISISVDDKDPKRAAQLANAYVDELYKMNKNLAITEAAQRRVFFEKELLSTKDDLAAAEIDLRQTQEKTGIIQPDSQAKAMIESVAVLRGQIAAKEVQLRSMQSFGTEQNPDIMRTGQELEALRSELFKLQKGQNGGGDGDVYIATGKIPSAGLEYLRKLRNVKYYETILEVLSKQYEIARIDEARNVSLIQVVDPAIEPEKKSKPKRLIIVAMFTMSGLFLSILLAFVQEYRARLLSDPESAKKIDLLRAQLWRSRN